MRRLAVSALAAIGGVGPMVADGAHGVAHVVACVVIAVAAGSASYGAQQKPKKGGIPISY